MRINAGILKGRKLIIESSKFEKNNKNFRPTEGVIREAVISILRMDLPGSSFLDLFAGSGAVGFEAYSNGATEVFFVEKEPKYFRAIKNMIDTWGVTARVLMGDYRTELKYLIRKHIRFNFVYIDPPYHMFSYDDIIKHLSCDQLLKEGVGATVFIERHYRSAPPTEEVVEENRLKLERSKKYGSVVLDILKYQK